MTWWQIAATIILGAVVGLGLILAGLGVFDAVSNAINLKHMEKNHGRYRKAAEAHRARAAGGTLAGSGGSALGSGAGTGAGMNDATRFNITVDTQKMQDALSQMKSAVAAAAAVTPTTPQAGEFAGFGFAAGVVRGARAFDIDTLGRLTGVSFPAVWKPGENEAQCMKRNISYAMMTRGINLPTGDTTMTVSDREPHGLDDCKHGFYGYYDGSNDYALDARISGIIEGYGETIIGTRGFRCTKARIVALHIGPDVTDKLRRLVERNYKDIPFFDSFEQMVAEFPPDDAGSGVTPDNDPEFWSRTI